MGSPFRCHITPSLPHPHTPTLPGLAHLPHADELAYTCSREVGKNLDEAMGEIVKIVEGCEVGVAAPMLAKGESLMNVSTGHDTVSYREDSLRYLAIMQDFRVRGLPEQTLHVKLPAPAYVYDVRAGKMLFKGQGQEWDAQVGRGYPLVYALLPYQVAAVKPQAPAAATRGQEAAVKVAVQATQPAGFHVVRLNVFAPGQTAPHRQYSQNLACPQGLGAATIPFAVSDPQGLWRLVWRDVATGVTAESKLVVK